ncbi:MULTISPECIES: SctD/MshK family protein [Aeromonas]|uniref:MSHA biogenesis protein MshK n=1 Tax=Aeromonas salmonicida TaxID=645 RepID=A0AAX3VQ27_AERSA|nr:MULTISPECIES: MSHA biogenesis protein MshK [Aeromonas]MDF2393314.1 MSHA biogenesis protein MshK [Aeromonas sp. 2MA4]WHF35786.1 MSHA biogenesis protein MshK [Aeromonas salmonicida]
MVRWLTLLCCLLGSVAKAEVLQDPTEPLEGVNSQAGAVESQSAGLPKLQSVVLGNGPALAVLNGKSYRIGQQVEGYRLVAISADAVVLEKGGKRQSLTLFASKVRI